MITGATRGQGAAAAGAFVVATDILDDEGAALAGRTGPGLVYRHLDGSSEDEWSDLAA
ncbi:hypothetical protein GCM10009850_120900 [Nonomuraea monospora]|uniref:Uncharacterized protein n=1 Tax=Nonomuraea monospora TaxID=568818 RepID=A0ABN3D572_9ACTN